MKKNSKIIDYSRKTDLNNPGICLVYHSHLPYIRAMEPQKFIGRRIREYQIISLIGQGGMAAVLKAEHVKLKTIRAVKIIRSSLSRNPKFIDRFNREARLLVPLRHPNLVQIFDFFEEEGHLFLVMNYVPGESLAHRLKHQTIMSPQEILPLVIQALSGLGEAHQFGIVHRDISPDNLMITKHRSGRDQAVIIDFGIAKAFSEESFSETLLKSYTVSGSFVGKVAYCSPEQAVGETLDGRSDLYSLGLVLHRALTGTIPFRAETPVESLAFRRIKEPPTLEESLPGNQFPDALENCLQKALSRNMDNRYQNTDAFRSDLITILKTEGSRSSDPMVTITIDGDESFDTESIISSDPDQFGRGDAETLADKPSSSRWFLTIAAISAGVIFIILMIWFLRSCSQEQAIPLTVTPGEISTVAIQPATATPLPTRALPSPEPPGETLPVIPASEPDVIVPKTDTAMPIKEGTATPTTIPPTQTPIRIPKGFALIRAGRFEMGSPANQPGYLFEEQLHPVTITGAFFLGKREVTQKKWVSVMGSNPSRHKGDSLPVETITWFDAVIFCNRLSRQAGLSPCYFTDREFKTIFTGSPPVTKGTVYWKTSADGYRLPTEAEWEYACRGGSADRFFFGNNEEDLDRYGWYHRNAEGRTHEIGRKSANPLGLFDMYGNIIEWCWDWQAAYETRQPRGPEKGTGRVLRGGSWRDNERKCRSAARYSQYPGYRSNQAGFRLVRSLR